MAPFSRRRLYGSGGIGWVARTVTDGLCVGACRDGKAKRNAEANQ